MTISSAQLHKIDQLRDGRLLEESLLLAEECYSCEHFKSRKCELLDELQYCKRLAFGHCRKWDFTIPDRFATINDGRIKIVLPTIALMCGGAERWLVDLATGLNKKRYCVCVAIQEYGYCDPPLLEKARKAEFITFGRRNVQKVLDAADISLSWCYFPQSRAKYKVFCSHGCDKHTMRLVSHTPRAPDYRITAVSKVSGEPWKYLVDDVDIIHNGCDVERLRIKEGREATRESLGVEKDEILIGFISRMIPEKRPELVSKAAYQLRKRGFKAKALFVGVPKGYSKYSDCLYLPRVEFLGDLYAALDCFMLPSESEAFSLAITEAWLCGVPVVTTPVGAIPELEEKHGRLVIRGTDETAVLEAISDKNKSVVDRAKRLAYEHFTKQAMVKRWERYFERIRRTKGEVSVA